MQHIYGGGGQNVLNSFHITIFFFSFLFLLGYFSTRMCYLRVPKIFIGF